MMMNRVDTTAKKIAAALGFDWQRFYEDEKTPDHSGQA